MPLPPPPPSGRPDLPQPRRKSSIRTASATVGEQFVQRMKELRDDPVRVVPEPAGDPVPSLEALRRRLESLRGGRMTLRARFDRGILGAVARSIPLADQPAPTRLLDAKVAGSRRFYLVRGHVRRGALLGVQNHDDPKALLLAYADEAKRRGFHLFAGERLFASRTPQPPPAWLEWVQKETEVALQQEGDTYACPHKDVGQVALRFRGGPALLVCAACGMKANGFHRTLRGAYAGPNQRQPFDVQLRMPDGTPAEPERLALARYRAGLDVEEDLLRPAVAQWRSTAKHPYLMGGRVYADQESFLDALKPEPWEREVLRRLTEDGYQGEPGVAAVLEARRGQLGPALSALVPDGPTFLAQHPGRALRDVVRAAHTEARRLQATASLPALRATGPVGQLVDLVARLHRSDGRAAALQPVRKAFEARQLARSHLFAMVQAMGGDLSLDARFGPDDRHGGESLVEPFKAVLAAEGAAYIEAVRLYLAESGSGESVTEAAPTA